MRKIVIPLLLLLIFAGLFPFIFPWKEGKPLLSWSALEMPPMPPLNLPEIPEITLPGSGETPREPHQPVQLYRWQGADGSIQFSNEPPPKGVHYEIIEVNPDANLIQAPAKGDSGIAPPPEPPVPDAAASPMPSPLSVTPGQALQLLEDARQMQELADKRLRQHESQMP